MSTAETHVIKNWKKLIETHKNKKKLIDSWWTYRDQPDCSLAESVTKRCRTAATTRWNCCRRRRTSRCASTTATRVQWSTRVSTNTCASACPSSSAACRPTPPNGRPATGSCATPPASVVASKVSCSFWTVLEAGLIDSYYQVSYQLQKYCQAFTWQLKFVGFF